jgi:alanyl-tRNA synthetase
VSKAVGSGIENVEKRVESIIKELETLKNTLKSYRDFYQNTLMRKIINEAEDLKILKLSILKPAIVDEEVLRNVLLKAVTTEPKLVVVVVKRGDGKTPIEISLGSEAQKCIDARKIVSELSKHVKLKAGGKPDHITGVIEEEKEDLEKIIKETIMKLLETKSKQD